MALLKESIGLYWFGEMQQFNKFSKENFDIKGFTGKMHFATLLSLRGAGHILQAVVQDAKIKSVEIQSSI